MQSCGVFDLDIWPGGGDVFSDLFIFLSMFFFAWIYLHGFTHMIYSHGFFSHEPISCLQNRNLSELN